MPLSRKPQPFLVQLYDLALIQLTNWRWSWRGMVITGMITPMASVTVLGLFARDAGPYTLGYILTGNLVLALMFEMLNKVASSFAFMRTVGTLTFFAALPVHRAALILASVFSFLLLALPAVAVNLVYGTLYLRIPIHPSPLLALVIPMCALPLAGLGALIGITVRQPDEAGSVCLLVTFLLTGCGPVMVPPERLPEIVIWLSWFSPAVYAASALRQALLGPVTARIVLDLGVLALVTAVSLWVVGEKMDWRKG